MTEKGKVYKFLNPVGIQEPVEQHPLAPRLDKLDGKRITLSVGAGGEQGILIPLVKKLPEKYPQVNWNISYAAPHATKAGSVALVEEERDKNRRPYPRRCMVTWSHMGAVAPPVIH